MSTTGEERNKKRGQPDGRPVNPQRPNATTKEASAPTQKRSKDTSTEQNSSNKPSERSSTPNLIPQDDHVPMKGFNTSEVDILLKRGFDTKASIYKSETQSQKSGGVWGTKGKFRVARPDERRLIDNWKAGAMATGKDFWLELRKQVTAIQQTGGVSQGG